MTRVKTCKLTWRLHFRNKSTAKTERICGSLWSGLRVTGISLLILYLVVLLPSEARAQKWKRLPGSSRRFQQCVATALSLGSIKGGYDSAHERELRTVWSEWEFHLDATNRVHILRELISRISLGFRVRPPFCINHFRSVAQDLSGGDIRTPWELPSLVNYAMQSSTRFDLAVGSWKALAGKVRVYRTWIWR